MPVRVYCPDCHAARTAPEFGARIRCRNCDRVFRAGTRAGRRDPHADRPPEDSTGAQRLIIVLAGVAILVFGLAIGGGLGAWWMLNRPPANDPDDDEVIEANEPADMPPPAVGPMNPRPVNPGPVAEPPAGPP
jgi:rubredoxin